MNNKAVYFLSWYFWLMMIVVAAAVVLGTLVFFNGNVDIREQEADILLGKLGKCASSGEEVNLNLFKEDFNFFKECRLIENEIKQGDYFVGIFIYDFNSCNLEECSKSLKEISFGDKSRIVDCELQREKSYSGKMSKCSVSVFSKLKGKDKVLIKLYAAIGKQDENV